MLTKKTSIQVILLVYNLASSSLYFISAVFFLQHIGYAKSSPLSNWHASTNRIVLCIATIGFFLMFFSQQFNLYNKAMHRCEKIKFQWISDLGVYYRRIVMSTSFFALINDFVDIYVSIPIALIAAFGAFELNKIIIMNAKPHPLIVSKFYCFYLSFSYAASLSALYLNTMKHIFLSILNQRHLVDAQLLLIMPSSFFTFFFFIGMLIYSLSILDPNSFSKEKFPPLLRSLMPLFTSNCVIWKSIVNTMSLVSLTYLVFAKVNEVFYLFVSIILFTIISLSQTIFFSQWKTSRK